MMIFSFFRRLTHKLGWGGLADRDGEGDGHPHEGWVSPSLDRAEADEGREQRQIIFVSTSKDNGYTWTEVGKNIPGGTREFHISGLEASWYDAGTAYASIDGHYVGDLKPYVFQTTDYGKTWTSVTGDLPHGNVNSIRQDPKNRNILYAAAEFGFFVSLDEGKTWKSFMPGLPKGRVDEVVEAGQTAVVVGTAAPMPGGETLRAAEWVFSHLAQVGHQEPCTGSTVSRNFSTRARIFPSRRT